MPGKRSGKRSFDTDEEEVPEIIYNENDSDGEMSSNKPKRRTCCSPILIILLVLVVGAAVGFLLYFFLFKPDDAVPSPSPASSPASSPVSARVLEKLCSEENSEGKMKSISLVKEPVFMIELIQFSNDNERAAFNSYEKFLTDTLEANNDGEVVFEMELPDWDKAMVTKFRNGDVFRDQVLENEEMTETLARRKEIKTSTMWAATLNTKVQEDYPELIGQPGNPEKLLFHGLKFLEADGQNKVDSFDNDTKDIKSSNYIFMQGWFDVEATCIGEEDEFDQFRIESIRTIADYAKVFVEPVWLEASKKRAEGVDYQSFTDFSESYDKVTNLYN
mmetsp:Transcript_10857/g.16003  ORF Transcript_10857/g.16003 Transcript_10857/m.16003 type:complete len:332 (+) Transcript_10857:128-1123(+)|eukprot:CAMPEP_0194203730 /NCGR_PEP_ID=MMETSP0156-20130528/3428_1 /TAXON_ID=33649 /ORGANISM="Thalassionema nitzschioides, Strain L26-B" /LENGTH=331 /DNA_ID=CAMNT_0038929541 /DNA_START=55 /DNA_END=1050 /DNA_ORIENTATION=-